MNKAFNVRATTENMFLFKYLLIGAACFAFFLWSTYDAFVAYPAKIPRGQAWEKIKKDDSLDDAAQQEKWIVLAKEKGWSTKRPTKKESPDSVRQTIIWNYAFMAIGFGIAAPCIIWYFLNNGTWIEADKGVLRNSRGAEVPIGKITKIDKKKWEKKGIAIVSYTADDGSEKTFTIDDLKYQRNETDQILAWVEGQVKRDVIVNGSPEAEVKIAEQPKSESTEE